MRLRGSQREGTCVILGTAGTGVQAGRPGNPGMGRLAVCSQVRVLGLWRPGSVPLPSVCLPSVCLPPGGVPGGLLQHRVLDDRPTSRDQPIPALLGSGHRHRLGGPVFGTADRSRLQLPTGGKVGIGGLTAGVESYGSKGPISGWHGLLGNPGAPLVLVTPVMA